ncbi:conserved exported protein of unknown function [Pararobbsia alpina]|jgi:hypothetical protein|uniref:hypothetical protein n=1 Tax=Pararobbsia alpina TaxID=621374 RepID=UPI0039A5D072
MKKSLLAALLGAVSIALAGVSVDAVAQAGAPAPKPKTVKKLKKSKKAQAKEAAKVDPVPDGADTWNCAEGAVMYLKGDMSKDMVMTLHWKDRNYKLPRVITTTGADRFYDTATGFDLVVIPTKAMLFDDTGDRERLADECKTDDMAHNGALAPTQSNALKNGQQ